MKENRYIKLSLAVLLGLFSANAIAKNDSAEIKALKARLSKLEKLFGEYKKATNGELDELNARVDDNEFQSSSNRIKWGGELEVTDGNYKGSYHDSTNTKRTYNNTNKWTTKLKLNMHSRITDKIKFTGRLSMYKSWADATGSMMYSDANYGKNYNSGNSGIYVERAYIDYTPFKNWYITIGRQPSSDGPGANFKNNTPRKATYPALLFDGAADGIVVTKKFDYKGFVKHFKLRAAYGKGFQKDDSMNGFFANDNGIKDLDVIGAFAEWSFNYKPMGSNIMILSYVNGSNFIGSPLDTSTNNTNLGDFDLWGVHFENKHTFGTKFNYFISYGHSKGKSNGKIYMYNTIPYKLINGSGHSIFVGGRYDFKRFKIGYEFNKGSKNWFSFTQGSEDPMNKLATRGKVHDVYVIAKLDEHQFLRLGYTKIYYDYIMSGWHMVPGGTPAPTDDTSERVYLTYNIKW